MQRSDLLPSEDDPPFEKEQAGEEIKFCYSVK